MTPLSNKIIERSETNDKKSLSKSISICLENLIEFFEELKCASVIDKAILIEERNSLQKVKYCLIGRVKFLEDYIKNLKLKK